MHAVLIALLACTIMAAPNHLHDELTHNPAPLSPPLFTLPLTHTCRGPLLLAGLVVSALSAIFLVSCIDMWDAYSGSGANNELGGWASLAALANSTASLQTPHNILPSALAVPLTLGGAGSN